MFSMTGLHAGQVKEKVIVKKKAPYKSEPPLKDVEEVIEECNEVADKFKIDPLGEIECPIPSEVEL